MPETTTEKQQQTKLRQQQPLLLLLQLALYSTIYATLVCYIIIT